MHMWTKLKVSIMSTILLPLLAYFFRQGVSSQHEQNLLCSLRVSRTPLSAQFLIKIFSTYYYSSPLSISSFIAPKILLKTFTKQPFCVYCQSQKVIRNTICIFLFFFYTVEPFDCMIEHFVAFPLCSVQKSISSVFSSQGKILSGYFYWPFTACCKVGWKELM